MADNTIEQNLAAWDRDHKWSKDGDEWGAGPKYQEWKQSVVDHLIRPYLTSASTVLEIAPGHGRWTEHLLDCRRLILVDLSQSCIQYCRKRFGTYTNVSYHVGDGRSLPADSSGDVDFVFSLDSFVHIGASEIASYLRHIHRVLKPGGKAIIHHANRRHATLWLGFLRQLGARRLYRYISMDTGWHKDGWRSNVSKESFARMAKRAGLTVDQQILYWADGFGVPELNDRVTVLSK